VVGAGGEGGGRIAWLSGKVLGRRRWLVQVRRIVVNGIGAPEKNASATTSLIPKDVESICVPDDLRTTTVSESRGLIVHW
jgi:hypothetical protein